MSGESAEADESIESPGLRAAMILLMPPLYHAYARSKAGDDFADLWDESMLSLGRYKRLYIASFGVVALLTPLTATPEGLFLSLLGLLPHIYLLLVSVDLAVGLPVDVLIVGGFRLALAGVWAGATWRLVGSSSGLNDDPSTASTLVDAARAGFALPLASTRGSRLEGLGLDDDTSVAIIGETGSGKSNTMYTLAAQFWPQAPVFCFDYKDDYKEFFGQGEYQRDHRIISVEGSTHYWNVFFEADTEADLDQIAALLFDDDSGDDYFSTAARQVFAGCLKAILRDARAADETPTNADVRAFFESTSATDAYDVLDAYDDLTPAAQHLSPEADRQRSSVWSTTQSKVLDTFVGDFAKEGGWSVSDDMRADGGPAVILDYDRRRGESSEPVLALLADLAAQECLATKQTQYMILDEFQALPRLSKIERLVNAGRAEGVIAFFGLQSLDQLISTYGRADARSLIAGMPQMLAHRPGDDDTTELIQDRIGKRRELVETRTESDTGLSVSKREKDRNPITSEQINNLATGEVVVITQEWWRRAQVAEATPDVLQSCMQAARQTFSR